MIRAVVVGFVLMLAAQFAQGWLLMQPKRTWVYEFGCWVISVIGMLTILVGCYFSVA